MLSLKTLIDSAYENRAELTPQNASIELVEAIETIISLLDSGKVRVAEKINDKWHTHDWLKKAILLYFRVRNNELMESGCQRFFDKIPLKFEHTSTASLQQEGIRIVPAATVRKGAYIGSNTILMPSYVNLGAYVDSGSMIDTWATVGSCAQIGKNVHLSGGVGIGGVLEPLQANPTIIEDNCFIGARSEVVEGVIVGEGSVLSMGVYLSQSTRIYDRETGNISYGIIPPDSVVVPGNLPSSDGLYSLYCAVIVKKVDRKTLNKIGLNELLRSLPL